MTQQDLTAIANVVGAHVRQYFADGIASRDRQIAELHAQIAALKAHASPVKYGGVFQQGQTYREGDLVSRRGGLWVAKCNTTSAPGTMPEAWLLVVKSGGA